MSDKIKLLPEIVANQIAAGEVVNSPSSVVKEMMENSIDAGAHCIKVNYRDGGKELIQIVDDGCGMSPVDARMAFDRHATSKISTVDDIYKLRTFGFRGEALASIAAVAQVELRTRQPEDETGTETIVNGGEFISQKPVMAPVGSQFMVRNLFYNVPARRKFVGDSTRLASQIKSEFQRVALCNPDVAFELYANDAPIYRLPRTTLAGRIIDVIGKHIKQNLLEVETETSIVDIKGYIGQPSVAKKRNNEQFLFVNGRFFKSQYLNKAILKAYEKLIPEGSFPSFFIFMKVNPERVDVNVHPQKTEVKFADLENIWQILLASVRETLAKTGAVPLLDFDDEAAIEIPISQKGVIYTEPRSTSDDDYNPFREGYVQDSGDTGRRPSPAHERYAEPTPAPAAKGRAYTYDDNDMDFIPTRHEEMDFIAARHDTPDNEFEFIASAEEPAAADTLQLPQTEDKQSFTSSMYIGNGYAGAIYGGRFVIVDLRRARERILYESYLMLMGNSSSVSQQLLFPERLMLSNDEYALLEENAPEFASLGFDIDFEGDGTIVVKCIPAETASDGTDELIFELLQAFDTPAPAVEMRRERLACTMARNASRTFGRNLSDNDVAQLLDQLAMSDNICFSPSGKPIMAEITPDELRSKLG
ncbi:MAG TPA: DNA mismatch repair endonuclease MutL [Candidatus Alistipes excrementipullorum]|nr:DNA mismatch repair endonuclease MutL [Candidatus Alistipes excrementipullorum]